MKKRYIEKATKLALQKAWQREKKKEDQSGLVEGRAERNNEIAKKMKEEGLDIEIIVKVTGVAKEEIEKL